MEPQRFAARWSVSTWITTAAVVVLLVGAAAAMIWAATQETHGAISWVLAAGGVLLAALVVVTVLFAPVGYEVSRNAVEVRRVSGRVVIRLEQIGEVRSINSREIGFVVRVFGSGGFFGWYGQFYGRHLGSFTAYCSNTHELVLLVLANGRRILISPNPASEFLRAVESVRRARA